MAGFAAKSVRRPFSDRRVVGRRWVHRVLKLRRSATSTITSISITSTANLRRPAIGSGDASWGPGSGLATCVNPLNSQQQTAERRLPCDHQAAEVGLHRVRQRAEPRARQGPRPSAVPQRGRSGNTDPLSAQCAPPRGRPRPGRSAAPCAVKAGACRFPAGTRVRSCHLRQSTEYPQERVERSPQCVCQAGEAGLFKMLHTDGSHPGLSDEDHSTFRLHLALVTGQALLHRLSNRT